MTASTVLATAQLVKKYALYAHKMITVIKITFLILPTRAMWKDCVSLVASVKRTARMNVATFGAHSKFIL